MSKKTLFVIRGPLAARTTFVRKRIAKRRNEERLRRDIVVV
jgi:hypothetical protein